MLKQDQIDAEGQIAFERFYALAGLLRLENGSAMSLSEFATEPKNTFINVKVILLLLISSLCGFLVFCCYS